MAINYPPSCNTPAEKLAYCLRYQELVKKLRNVMRNWHFDGISQAVYDQLPPKVRARYSYTQYLSEADWKDSLLIIRRLEDNWMQEEGLQKTGTMQDQTYNINLDDDI